MPRKKKDVAAPKVEEVFVPDAFCIRTSNADGTSYGGFQWPKEVGAVVTAPDWNPEAICGYGLHGLLDGIGAWGLLSSDHDALWWIIGVKRSECINIDDKVKFPRGKVVYVGGINGALNQIATEWRRVALEAAKEVVTEATSTSGDSAHTSTSGYYAHASTSGNYAQASTSGNRAHASTSGDYAHASTSGDSAHTSTSGNRAHASTSGDYAHASTSGDYAHASTSGYYAHASTSGNRAHASTSGNRAHASTSGDYAHASTSGDSAHASTSGDKSVSVSLGYAATAQAVEGGAICLVNLDDEYNIVAIRASKVGENGIKAGVKYSLNTQGEFVEENQ